MMNKNVIAFLGAGCILAGLPCAAGARLLSTEVAHVPKFIKVAQETGPENPLQLLTLAIHLRYPDERAVHQFVEKVSNPRSPSFGAFLTPGQFTKSFEPTGHTYSTVEYVLTGAGGSLLETFTNNKVLVVALPVLAADVLFGTTINQYSLNGKTYYANGTPAYLPSLLKGLVRSVSGFTNYPTRGASPPWPLGAPGIGPVQIETAYDEPIAVNPQLNGSGTTIAIATAGDYEDSDVAGYWSTYGVTRMGSLTRIPVAGSQLRRRGLLHAPMLGPETTLDVEQTTSNAPGANVEVYEGSDTLGTTFAAIYADIVDDPNVDVVTTSFGACEIGADESELLSDNDLFEQGAAEGQTWFAASGDNGSHDCGTNSPPFGYPGEPNPNSVDFPASSPYVTAAGGTTLGLNAKGGIATERAWSGSGGGVSRYFDRPAYQDPVPNLAGPKARNVPDVALDADPGTPYAFYFEGSSLQTVAGTSAVAPNLAALFAQIDQGLGYRVGLAQSGLYHGFATGTYPGGAAWHDITKGANGRYHAVTGFDDATGVGSLDGYQLMLQMPAAAQKARL
jgi:kumamolisin